MLQKCYLLTFLVGLILPLSAQIEPGDSLQGIPRPVPGDSLRSFPDSVRDTRSLSTDSVYATPAPGNGLLEAMVEYTATDSIKGSVAAGLVFLYRDGYVKYQEFELKAGFIKIDFNKKEIYAEGLTDTSGRIIQKPVFIEGGKSYRSDNMRYNFDTKKAKIHKVITQEGEGFLHGEEVKKVGEQVFYIRNAAYTTCSHEHPHFNIKSHKAKVVGGDKVVTKLAYLELLDVPTPLMVPFGFFPTTEQRKSGIILPSYGSSEFRGYFLRGGGYYWAINDYVDLTALGDIFTQGGYGVQVESNYRKRYAFSGNLNVNYNRIKIGREEFNEFLPSAFDDRAEFGINWSHSQDPKARPDFRFNSNVNIATSNFYRLTSTNANEVLNNNLASSVSIQKSFPGRPFNLNASLTHNQNNASNRLTLKLPQLNFSVNRLFPFKRNVRVGKKRWYEEIGVTYTASAENTIRTRLGKPIFTETVFRDSANTGVRHNLQTAANYKILKHIVFNPSINYTERWYFKRSDWAFDPEQNRARVADTVDGFYAVRDFRSSANFSTKLYGMWRYRGFLRALRHVATPTVGLSYQPDFGRDFWGYYQEVQTDTLGNTNTFSRYNNGVYGSPGQGEQGNLNFNLLNTLEAKIRDRADSSGVKKVKILERFSLSTSYNMAADEFQWAPLNLTASSSAFNNLLNFNYNGRFEFYGYDEEAGQRVEDWAWEINDRLLRPTSQSLAFTLNLNANRFKNQKPGKKKTDDEEPPEDENKGNDLGITRGDIDYYRRQGFVDFSLPWNLRLNYNINQSYRGLEPTVRQSIDASGDFELTKSWRIGFRTGYDLEAEDFTFTSLDFFRDLHCWELRASWVPFGIQQSYTITIRVKAQSLSDLKMERRRGYGDFVR